jgi:predicted dienelactone hydrolase
VLIVVTLSKPRRTLVVSVLALLIAVGASRCDLSAQGVRANAVAPRVLPAPTGMFKVGRVTFHLIDRSRREHAPPGGAVRELMVDVWYPAERSSGPAAPYFEPSAFFTPRTSAQLKRYLGSVFDAVKAGRVRTHAVAAPAYARGAGRSPVLLFSHGGGEAREAYATQLADLASHGYAVAALTHTFDSVLAVFPDGRHASLLPDRWPPPRASAIPHLPPSEEANADRLQWWADDIRFVLDELTRLNGVASSNLPFAGHLDLSRAGAFGHSAGGQASAHACQVETRLRACLNQDGLSAMAPYYLDDRGWGMDQAFMLIVRAARTDPPTDDELARMGLTRAEADALLARLRLRQEETLRRTGRGSYRITLSAEATTHGDFGDLPLLRASTVHEAAARARVLQTIAGYTRAFFDRTLRQIEAPLPDGGGTGGVVTRVEAFPAATRPGR